MSSKKGLAELLVSSNILDLEQLDQARRDQRANGGRLTTAVVRLGFLKDAQLVEFMGKEYGLPTIDLAGFEVDPEAIKALSRQVCEKHMVIPVSKAGKVLVVAFSDPSNIYVKDDLALLTRCKIEVVVTGETSIMSAIDKYYGSSSKIENLVSEIEEGNAERGVQGSTIEVVDQEAHHDEGPIVKFVNAMLSEAIKTRTSDIHIEPYEKRFRIRFRIDGALVKKPNRRVTPRPPSSAVLKF